MRPQSASEEEAPLRRDSAEGLAVSAKRLKKLFVVHDGRVGLFAIRVQRAAMARV